MSVPVNALYATQVRRAAADAAQAVPANAQSGEVPENPAAAGGVAAVSLPRRIFRERPWARVSTALIATGALMLMQPFSIELYGYSFVVLLGGVAGMTIAARLPR